MSLGDQFRCRAFGLLWDSDRPLDQFLASTEPGPGDVTVRRQPRLRDRPGGTPINNGEVFPDGARFRFGDATFDVFDGERVEWASPEDGGVPAALFGTVAAIVLALRGLVPLHGSAVEIDGQAVLLAGPSGAGKSTLCEALIQRGGRLVSDDLSAMNAMTGEGVPTLLPGRPAVRLFPDGAPAVGLKHLYPMPMVDLARTVPLRSLILLQRAPPPAGLAGASEALMAQLFRPRWMQVLPHRRTRTASLFYAARTIAIFNLPGARDRPDISIDEKADQLMFAVSNVRRHALSFGE